MLRKHFILAAVFLIASSATYSSSISDTQNELISWVQTKKVIAETKAEWNAEKRIVEDLISLLEVEKAKYEQGIEALEGTDDASDQKRSVLNAEKERLMAATSTLEEVIPELEGKTRDLLAKLPSPLLAELDPLLRRLPEPGEDSRMAVSQRLLTVVGILNKIDKFNTGITIKSEIRNLGGSSSEVTTLYFGLAGAYFSDDSGAYAGIGVPGNDGWVWTEKPEIAAEVIDLIRSYQGAREAKFVSLPVQSN